MPGFLFSRFDLGTHRGLDLLSHLCYYYLLRDVSSDDILDSDSGSDSGSDFDMILVGFEFDIPGISCCLGFLVFAAYSRRFLLKFELIGPCCDRRKFLGRFLPGVSGSLVCPCCLRS